MGVEKMTFLTQAKSKILSPNISLKTTPTASFKLPTATSLNNNIKPNSVPNLLGGVQLNKIEEKR